MQSYLTVKVKITQIREKVSYMPNFEEHFGISAITGLVAYVAAKKQAGGEPVTAGEAIGVAILSGAAGALPDAIEPPTSPKHRKFFHSTASLGILIAANRKLATESHASDTKALFAALSVAYAMHLLADSGTSAGLPLY